MPLFFTEIIDNDPYSSFKALQNMKTTNADRGSAAPEDEDITSFNVVFVTAMYHFKECCQRMSDRDRKSCATDRQGWRKEALLILL